MFEPSLLEAVNENLTLQLLDKYETIGFIVEVVLNTNECFNFVPGCLQLFQWCPCGPQPTSHCISHHFFQLLPS